MIFGRHREESIMNGISFSVPAGGRLICIADCHGNYVLLKRLIERLSLRDEDVLAILGDFSNKGWGNLSCTAYLMHLEKTRPHTIVLAGNGEFANVRSFLRGDREWILGYIKKWPVKNIYLEWARQCGFTTVDETNIDMVHPVVLETFGDMMRWMRDLPLYAYNDDYLLVHSGLEEMPENGIASPDCLDNRFLMGGCNRTGRWEIVGHLPVGNFLPGQLIPLCREDKTIDIDGGTNTRDTEQLNALLCTPEGFLYTFEDQDEARIILQDYSPKPLPFPPIPYHWSDRAVDVLREEGPFCFCRTKKGREGLVKKESLVHDETGVQMIGCTLACLLPVHAGETVKVLDVSAKDYWLVKNRAGLMGYVPASIVGSVVPASDFADTLPLF